MRVALTGASGFIGAHAAQALAQEGHQVVALVRPTSRTDHIASAVERFVVGDHADRACWRELLRDVDALVHNSLDRAPLDAGDLQAHLRSNLEASILLLDEARSLGVRRLVFVSSVAVHHRILPRWKGLVDEDHPTRPRSWYGAYKAAVEDHLWALGHQFSLHVAALRPAAVYGLDPRLERSHGHEQVRRLLAGEPVHWRDFPGGGKWVHVEDVALAIVRAAERDEAGGQPFHLADCYAKFTRFGELAAELLGLPASMVDPDPSPPARNRFDKTAARETLSVPLDRGEAGLREHVRQLIDAVKARQA